MFGLLGEGRVPKEISFQELHVRVGEIAAALKNFGIKQGDRIAGKMLIHKALQCCTCSLMIIRISAQLCFGCRGYVSDIKFGCNLVLNFTRLWCLGKD